MKHISSTYLRKHGLTRCFEFKTTWEKSQKTSVPRGQIQNTLKKKPDIMSSNATTYRKDNPVVSADKGSSKKDKLKHAIHWVRKDLRLHDNPSLLEAVKGSDTVRVIYVLDTKVDSQNGIGINLWRFLLQSLEDVDDSLRKLNSRLFVVRGQPTDVFPRLFREWKISHLTFEEDSEPFGRERDAAIRLLAEESGVDVAVYRAHTLYDPQL